MAAFFFWGELARMDNVQLSLAVIGAQKASTTALALYLNQHPEIYFPPIKETHFFRRSLTTSGPADRDPELLNRRFVDAPLDSLYADGTPIYLYWPYSVSLLKAHNPDMKLIVSLRHPAIRAYSAWSMERRRDRDPLSFSDAIREGRNRVKNAPFGVHSIYSYVERGFYAQQLRNVFEVFDPAQVFVMRSDQVSAQDQQMQALLAFLGVDAIEFEQIVDNVNPSSLIATEGLQNDFAYLQDLYREDLDLLSDMIDINISNWLSVPEVPF